MSSETENNPTRPIRGIVPVLEPGHTYASVTDKIASIVLTRPTGWGWIGGFAICFAIIMLLFAGMS